MTARAWWTRSACIFPGYWVKGQPLTRAWRDVRFLMSLGPQELAAEVDRRAGDLVAFLFESNPFYRRRLLSAGLDASAGRDRERFCRIPPLTKQEIVQFRAEMQTPGRWRLEQVSTSGSTGIPLVVGKDHVAIAYVDAVMHEFYTWHGIRLGDAQARVWRLPTRSFHALRWRAADVLLNRHRLNAHAITDDSSVAFVERLRRVRPTYLKGYPNATYEVALALRRRGVDPGDLGLRVVILTGETLYPYQRRVIEDVFKAPVANEYGSTENGIIAFECPRGGFHVAPTYLVEVLDSATGMPVPNGRSGEIVVTELESRAFPFLRYRLGDTVALRDGTCSCGVGTPLLTRVEGRVADVIVTPAGRKVDASILDDVLDFGACRYKAVQSTPGQISLWLIPDRGFEARKLADLRQLWARILGPDVAIEFHVVDAIPPDRSGKLRVFESRIG